MGIVKHLLIVYHSQTGHTEALAMAAHRGATQGDAGAVQVRCLRAGEAGVPDLLRADGLILATPENFGYMSGAMKDFLDRTYYPCEGRLEGMPYAVLISAGNDGTGAHRAITRIARGFPLKEVHPPIIVKGEVRSEHLEECESLGLTLAAGLDMGIF